ncbi:MAG: sulfite exporter TauE/SafE family protein [Candidatus Kapabacteria bacterium]|nr:sulfite exporter TauE/SafE family protein [Candidatus Kapabacteria bacterium]
MIEPVTGLLLGLAGGLHCAGMCGPIALALPSTGRAGILRFAEKGLYHVGRIATYSILGVLVGLGASVFELAGYGRVASITAGVLMIVTAGLQLIWHRNLLPSGPIHRITAPIRSRLGELLRKRSLLALTGIGLLNGLLPCGLVTSALLGSAATTEPLSGMIFMASFGVGTLPVMMSISLSGTFLTNRMRSSLRVVMPLLALVVGIVVILRGLALDIPYLSPPEPRPNAQLNCCGDH